MSRVTVPITVCFPAYIHSLVDDTAKRLSAIYGPINHQLLYLVAVERLLADISTDKTDDIARELRAMSNIRNKGQKLRLEHDKNQYQAYLTRRKRALFKSSTNASTADL